MNLFLPAWAAVSAFAGVYHYIMREPLVAAVWFLIATLAYGFYNKG